LSQIIFYRKDLSITKANFIEKNRENARSNFCCSFPLPNLSQISPFFHALLAFFIQYLVWIFVILIICYS